MECWCYRIHSVSLVLKTLAFTCSERCVLFSLCGYPPFYGDDLPILFESIMTADFDYPPEQWDSISDDGCCLKQPLTTLKLTLYRFNSSAIDFIDSLLVVDPKERLNADQALQHKWLTVVIQFLSLVFSLTYRFISAEYGS